MADDKSFWNQTSDGLAVLGSANLFRVYRLQRPVSELAIVADRLIPGRLDPVSGSITEADLHEAVVDDLLDDLAELVLRKGGEVVVVPTERMPTDTGAAAIFRF